MTAPSRPEDPTDDVLLFPSVGSTATVTAGLIVGGCTPALIGGGLILATMDGPPRPFLWMVLFTGSMLGAIVGAFAGMQVAAKLAGGVRKAMAESGALPRSIGSAGSSAAVPLLVERAAASADTPSAEGEPPRA